LDKNPTNNEHNSGIEDNNDLKPKAHPFNRRIALGLIIVAVIAIVSAVYITSMSTSPNISILKQVMPEKSADASVASNAKALAQLQGSDTGKIDKRFVLIQQNFGFNGTSGGPTINVKKGDAVQIIVINAGAMAHNFGIGKPSKEAMDIMMTTQNMSLDERVRKIPYNVMAQMPCPHCQPKFEEGHIKMYMKPDTMQVSTFKANEAGNFKYFCMVRGHIWLGMSGDLIVSDGAEGNQGGQA
jgi:uncharacterized cupredoxin-like copper-binding protein